MTDLVRHSVTPTTNALAGNARLGRSSGSCREELTPETPNACAAHRPTRGIEE